MFSLFTYVLDNIATLYNENVYFKFKLVSEIEFIIVLKLKSNAVWYDDNFKLLGNM